MTPARLASLAIVAVASLLIFTVRRVSGVLSQPPGGANDNGAAGSGSAAALHASGAGAAPISRAAFASGEHALPPRKPSRLRARLVEQGLLPAQRAPSDEDAVTGGPVWGDGGEGEAAEGGEGEDAWAGAVEITPPTVRAVPTDFKTGTLKEVQPPSEWNRPRPLVPWSGNLFVAKGTQGGEKSGGGEAAAAAADSPPPATAEGEKRPAGAGVGLFSDLFGMAARLVDGVVTGIAPPSDVGAPIPPPAAQPPSSPSAPGPAEPLDGAEDGSEQAANDGRSEWADVFNETSLVRLLRHRAWRRDTPDARERAARWSFDDNADLLVDDDDDPDHGLVFRVPSPAWIDPSLRVPARLQHEASAELAVVVPTAPRILLPWQEDTGATPNYWITAGDCKEDFVYKRLTRFSNNTLSDFLRRLAAECEADGPRCLGFDAKGRMREHYDTMACLISAAAAQSGPPMPEEALYWKRPPMVAALTRRLAVEEWPVQADGSTGPPPGSPYTIEPPTTHWWVLNRADVTARDLRQVDPTGAGRFLNEDAQQWYLRSQCLADPRCVAFTFPSGWLKYAADITDIHASTRVQTTLWSRIPIPPVDYLVVTVISLVRQMELASGGRCGFGLLSPADLLRAAGVELPPTLLPNGSSGPPLMVDDAFLVGEDKTPPHIDGLPDAFTRPIDPDALAEGAWGPLPLSPFANLSSNPFPTALPKIPDSEANGRVATLSPPEDFPAVPALRTHLYVVDTGSPELHLNYLRAGRAQPWTGEWSGQGTLPRSSVDDEYWFVAFAWLRKLLGHSPCITFVPATSYVRAAEVAAPLYGRGHPDFHTDNRGRNMPRQQTRQQLDFISAMRFAAARSPNAHMLVWEDDCLACPATLPAYSRAVAALSVVDPLWGGLKTGNGGSGILFNADIVLRSLVYLQTRRGSDNVDVAMWRFLHAGGWSEYISYRTRSAHRGLTSSFRIAQGSVWGRVRCGGELDYHWGFYATCDGTRLRRILRDRYQEALQEQEKATVAAAAAGGEAAAPLPLATRYALLLGGDQATYVAHVFMREWKCSAHSDILRDPIDVPSPTVREAAAAGAPPPPPGPEPVDTRTAPPSGSVISMESMVGMPPPPPPPGTPVEEGGEGPPPLIPAPPPPFGPPDPPDPQLPRPPPRRAPLTADQVRQYIEEGLAAAAAAQLQQQTPNVP